MVGNNYPNPLDKFRSHSYHFILVAASTTEAFRLLIEADNSAPLWNRVNNVALGESIELRKGSEELTAHLVVDTRRYSQFSITDFEAQHIFSGGSLNPTSPVSTTKMKLIDTTGLSFFNYITHLFRNKLKSTQMSSFFLLNVLFVGHSDDGTSETISSSMIPMILLTMGFEFTHIGSVYDIEFMEIEGIPQKTNPTSTLNELGITTTIQTDINSGGKLGDMMRALEESLNKRSRETYASYAKEALSSNKSARLGKLVQYMINLPTVDKVDWASYPIDTAKRSTNSEQRFLSRENAKQQQSGKEGEKAPVSSNASTADSTIKNRTYQITFSDKTTITDAIDHIMERSTALIELASKEKREAGQAVVYKIVPSITSDDTTYIVHFDIMPFYVPKLDKDGKQTVNRISGSQKPVNVIHYDYVFTGQNSHINDLKIEFSPLAAFAIDHNLELGGARLQQNASSGQNRATVEAASKSKRPADDSITVKLPNDPIFPVKSTQSIIAAVDKESEDKSLNEAVRRNKAIEESRATLSNLNFLSSLGLTMQIRGNPNLLAKYIDKRTRGGIAPHSQVTILSKDARNKINFSATDATDVLKQAVSGTFSSARDYYVKHFYQPRIEPVVKQGRALNSTTEDELLNGIDPATLPVFVKLNMRAPHADVPYETSQDEYIDFFYQGVYQILTITHKFSNGTFTQELQMIPYDPSGTEVDEAASAAKTPIQASDANTTPNGP